MISLIPSTEDDFHTFGRGGSCAEYAIGQSFNLDCFTIRAMFDIAKIKSEDGASAKECRKVLNSLARVHDKKILYFKCTKKTFASTVIKEYFDDVVLLFNDCHIFCSNRGIIKDSWLLGKGRIGSSFNFYIDGYWVIR